ncbi:MAG: ATP-binding cassette domain-containing protein [Bifidobacteriaceae bacterium]|jgi:ABC-2 type transport system ATP-binding protein|nr:ATP-binding cassette domain-containing protein [Bifidobacteriaceae bacterium]
MQNAPAAIAVRALRKQYGTKVVLDDVTLDVAPGSITALLGPNGAGKTTLVNICATLLPADGGSVTIGGHSVSRAPDAVRRLIGLTGQFAAVDPLLTGRQNLELMGRLRHLDRQENRRRAAGLLEQFELAEAADLALAVYSGGMRRRLDLAMTLMGQPRVIFLDEPTAGLDPRSRRTLWEQVKGLARDGATILLTTQYLDEADHLADAIAVLDRGRIVAQGTAGQLKRMIPGGHIRLRFSDASQLQTAARLLPGGGSDPENLTLDVPGDGSIAALRGVLARLDQAGVAIEDLSIHTPDLDDVFLAVTGKEIR